MKNSMFVVTVPALVPQKVFIPYIRDAVSTWSGQFSPDHPLFGTLRGKVRVMPFIKALGEGPTGLETAVDNVIDCARTVQAENGPDPDYRKDAERALAEARTSLLKLVREAS